MFAWSNLITILLIIILACVICLMIKQMNRLKKETLPAPPAWPPENVIPPREIRDAPKQG